MPPPAAADVAVAQFVDPLEPADGLLLLPHPAASTTQPTAAAMAAFALFPRTFFPSDA
jgi:hypothetical protein